MIPSTSVVEGKSKIVQFVQSEGKICNNKLCISLETFDFRYFLPQYNTGFKRYEYSTET